jgi:cell wall-associated NlpC family hydrolase
LSAQFDARATDIEGVVRRTITFAFTLAAACPSYAAAATVTNAGGVQVIVDGPPATPAPGPRRRPQHPHPAASPVPGPEWQSAQAAARASSIVRYALAFMGTPYVFGGSSPAGFDCSGFTQYVFSAAGIGIPRTADLQFNVGMPVADPRPGDLLFFQTYAYGASHVAIYLGNGWFVQAIAPNVHVSNFNSPYFRSRYLGARRVVFG